MPPTTEAFALVMYGHKAIDTPPDRPGHGEEHGPIALYPPDPVQGCGHRAEHDCIVAMPSSRKRRSLSPQVLAHAVNPLALGALLLLRAFSLISDEPLWKYLVVLWSGAVVSAITNWYFGRHTGRSWMQARVFIQTASVTGAIYITGWGPALAVTYAFMAPATLAESGARSWRTTAFWSVAWIGFGQVAIAMGWAPSLLEVPLVHGLAAVNAFGVVIVVRMWSAVSEQKESAEAALREREDHFRSLVQNCSDLILVLDPTGTVTYASEASAHLLGFAPDELIGLASATLVHPDDLEPLSARVTEQLASAAAAAPVELRARVADGGWRYLEAVVANLTHGASVGSVVVNARDITERKRAEAALEHQALHDGLTGLPNRIRLLDRLDHAIARAARHPVEAPAVVFLDIDHFKLINDGLGHEAGDDLLTQVGERLQRAMRPSDTVARFGGDEFVLVCEGVAGSDAAEALGQRVLGCFEQPFAIRGQHFVVSASVGVALLDGAASASDLVRHADEAMYRAKAHGRNRAEIFVGLVGLVGAEELGQPA
jgi:diguanylate cyclase (GGDEF)-like protein/PAS domain S-box-containing protein